MIVLSSKSLSLVNSIDSTMSVINSSLSSRDHSYILTFFVISKIYTSSLETGVVLLSMVEDGR